MNKNLNKDFYDRLPSCVCELLENYIIVNYGNKDWFNKAWEEYRQYVLNTNMGDLRMPGYIFNKYVEENNND